VADRAVVQRPAVCRVPGGAGPPGHDATSRDRCATAGRAHRRCPGVVSAGARGRPVGRVPPAGSWVPAPPGDGAPAVRAGRWSGRPATLPAPGWATRWAGRRSPPVLPRAPRPGSSAPARDAGTCLPSGGRRAVPRVPPAQRPAAVPPRAPGPERRAAGGWPTRAWARPGRVVPPAGPGTRRRRGAAGRGRGCRAPGRPAGRPRSRGTGRRRPPSGGGGRRPR
jgi:hypothetical protein